MRIKPATAVRQFDMSRRGLVVGGMNGNLLARFDVEPYYDIRDAPILAMHNELLRARLVLAAEFNVLVDLQLRRLRRRTIEHETPLERPPFGGVRHGRRQCNQEV